jgi:hypothetical protein
MAATWLWWERQRNRKLGEPVVDPFEQQPPDVTDPVNIEVAEVIRAIDTYDNIRDIIRVDLRQVNTVTAKLYQGLYPDWETSMTQEKLDALEGTVKIMLHHLRVEGDAPYDLD